MSIADDARWRAAAGRDRRFEGRFVMAVRTTGVYCRPGCPAPLPKRTNVRFFACAAAAEEAGFRPCLRCRPDAAPGSPAWSGTSTTVARALRLIAEGALDDEGVDALADRLGVGARHLRRLFAAHLGASPVAVARTRRVHFARKLLDETTLGMADVALASGFGSVRRFHDAMRATFHRPPSALRRAGRARDDAAITLHLAHRPPLAWEPIAAFLAPRAIPGIEAVADGAWRRTARGPSGAPAIVEVRPRGDALALTVRGAPADLADFVARARRVFDLDADPERIARHLRRDAHLAPIVRADLRVPGAWDPFEIAVRAILGQQVSVARATALAGALVRAFGAPLPSPDGALTHLFPTPAALARADVRGALGMPGARADAIRALAEAVDRGAVDLASPRGLDDAVARLRALPGVGPWTAQIIAMRALGEPDAFPSGDLGLRRAWEVVGAGDLDARAERWRPWRAYAAMTLWMHDAKGGGG